MGSVIDWGNPPDHLGGSYAGARTRPARTTQSPGVYEDQIRPQYGNTGVTSRKYPNQTALADSLAAQMLAQQPSRPRSASPEDVDAFVRDNYGQFAGFLGHPEIGPILREAAINGYDPGRLAGKVMATTWWKTTSAAQRTWSQLTGEDPAEAKRLVNQTAATIQNRARSLGLPLSSAQIGGMATSATANGWTDAQTVDMMLQQVNWATLKAGDLTAKRDDVRRMAGDYLVGVDEATSQNYAEAMASGEMTPEGVRSAMAQQAKARFGYLSSEIDQGMSVKQYFMPIANKIEQELELGSGAVDLMDSKWLSMIERRDETTGEMRAATLHEAEQLARRDPRWANTKKSQESSTNMMQMVAGVFGRSSR